MDGSEWSWDNINKLCWAVGSISGALSEESEKRFLVIVIKDLLTLVEMKRGKDNKAVVASNIMYVVGQYPRFLKAHWRFLKTVVNKLFEFMHELHEGVQDMACDTFIKIAQKCRRHFIIQQPGEVTPYIEEILGTIDVITSDLQAQQVHTFYEAVGYMIAAQPNKQAQERLVVKCMELPNGAWDGLMALSAQDMEALYNPDNVKILANILKTNVAACTSIGAPFIAQIGRIYMDLLGLYNVTSTLISQQVSISGLIATKTPRVRALKTIKKQVLRLIDTYVGKAVDLDVVYNSMIPPLLEAVLDDYNQNVAEAKEAQVLNVMANIISRLGPMVSSKVGPTLNAVFECTLSMINKDFEEYPEHRVCLFKLLQAINTSCFDAVLQMPPAQFRLYLDSIVWAFKHTMRDISDTGLNITLELVQNFSKQPYEVSTQFFKQYYISILQDVFFVLTSTQHPSGFDFQCLVLSELFRLVDNVGPLAPDGKGNRQFVEEFIANMLQQAFPHQSASQIQTFILGLFTTCADPTVFKSHMRDFLVTLKEFGEEEFEKLEREQTALEKQRLAQETKKMIPGMIKPSERCDFFI